MTMFKGLISPTYIVHDENSLACLITAQFT